jgi:hypothetical protein
MPYSSQIRMAPASGANLSTPARIILWEITTQIDSAGRVGPNEANSEELNVTTGSAATPFALFKDQTFFVAGADVALSAYVGAWPGPVFRSGRLTSLPTGAPANPAGLIDILLINPVVTTMASINAGIALRLPMTLTGGITVTSAVIGSVAANKELTLTAGGIYGAASFTYVLKFTIEPIDGQTVSLGSVFQTISTGPGTATFAPGPGGGGGVQAFLDNMFFGLFEGTVRGRVVSFIDMTVNAAAFAGAAAAAGAAGAPGGTLPPGVGLGASHTLVDSAGNFVSFPAVASFGPLLPHFAGVGPTTTPVPTPTPGGRTCVLATVAASGAGDQLLGPLRLFRSRIVTRDPAGARLVADYYRHTAEARRIILHHPRLLARAVRLLAEGSRHLRARRRMPHGFLRSCYDFALQLERRASRPLAAAIRDFRGADYKAFSGRVRNMMTS